MMYVGYAGQDAGNCYGDIRSPAGFWRTFHGLTKELRYLPLYRHYQIISTVIALEFTNGMTLIDTRYTESGI